MILFRKLVDAAMFLVAYTGTLGFIDVSPLHNPILSAAHIVRTMVCQHQTTNQNRRTSQHAIVPFV